MQKSIVRHLLTLQVAFFVICVMLSGMVFMPLALVTKGFQCMLFSDINLKWNSNNTVTVDLLKTKYGSINDCEVPTFIGVSVCVVCIIFAWFYLCSIFSAASDDSKQSTNRIQIPALLIFLSLFISTIVAASKISAGFRVLCQNIVDNAPEGPHRKLTCYDFQNLQWTDNINSFMFYTRYKIAEVACWLLCVSLFALCCVTCIGYYQMLQAGNKLSASQDTLSLTLDDSEIGNIAVVKTRKEEEKAEIEGSSQDYFTPLEDQVFSSEDAEPRRNKESLLSTEATVHSGIKPDEEEEEEKSRPEPPPDIFMRDYADVEGFVESGRVASGRINTSDNDEVPSDISSLNSALSSGNQDEKDALAKKGPVNGGYGAVSSNR